MREYLPRVYDGILRQRVKSKGAVLIEGPKWCGKTTTAEQIARSVVYLQDPRTKTQNLRLAEIAPRELLKGEVPRLIDEWQLAPQLWDAVRFEVDQRDDFGQFILTGSAVPADTSSISHTGTGRIARLKMRPMSLVESRDSTGAVSLEKLFGGERVPIVRVESSLEHMAFLLCRGGWPKAAGLNAETALLQAPDYLDGVVNSDISRVDKKERDPRIARALLRSYARMSASQGKVTEMLADVNAQGVAASESTIRDYVKALGQIFVIEDLLAWNPNLRSRTAIRTAPTRHFVDPSIAAAALSVGPGDLMADLNTFGLLFESMCVRDLRAYADVLGGDVYHYRDRSGLEADAVVHLRDGRYGLVEVKLGGDTLVNEGAKSLLALQKKIDVGKVGSPSFLMILTATGDYSYYREDGVYVVPLNALAP
ncbi:ATP-binding protein [Adlercreutzia sp. ZJ242]|uniref:ATP-binding protein n=1 Tax=Adlercreutzia sp. ZJ242 TaxID=2709409 RepID=UPI0013ED6048|nr:DUF4143 domain-containing protein [Adlercreutzia sp. ZJ242]